MIPPGGVLFADPGVMTGCATLKPDGSFDSWQGRGFDVFGAITSLCRAGGTAVSVCWERFTITPATFYLKGSEAALEVIGALRYVAYVYGCEVLPASPRDARRIAPDALLRDLGWHRPGKPHANDAARHLFSWALSTENLPEKERAMLLARGQEGRNDGRCSEASDMRRARRLT